jgi:hypothetical protein
MSRLEKMEGGVKEVNNNVIDSRDEMRVTLVIDSFLVVVCNLRSHLMAKE